MTTTLSGVQLRRLVDDPTEVALLDLRTPADRARGFVPLSVSVPWHDLEQRVRTLVPRRGTRIVLVSGRELDDRAAVVLGELGYGDVAVLEDGPASWTRVGGRLLVAGPPPTVLPIGGDVPASRAADVEVVDRAELRRRLASIRTTTYVLDVRSAPEYAAGHIAGSRPVPPDALVQDLDAHVAVRRAAVVLVDTEDRARSSRVIAWLRRLHDGPVSVHVHDGTAGPERLPWLPELPWVPELYRVPVIHAAKTGSGDLVLDVRHSSAYAAAHLPGSTHVRREDLPALVPTLPDGRLVVVGDDAHPAGFIAAELRRQHLRTVVVLDRLPVDGLTSLDPRWSGPIRDETAAVTVPDAVGSHAA